MEHWFRAKVIDRPRILAATLTAPMLGVLAIVGFLIVAAFKADGPNLTISADDIPFGAFALLTAYLNGLLAVIVVGLPLYFFLRAKRRHVAAAYVLAGYFAGSLININFLNAIFIAGGQNERLFGAEPSNPYVLFPEAFLSSWYPFGLLGAGSGALFFWILSSRKSAA